jgi:hypothetical protein
MQDSQTRCRPDVQQVEFPNAVTRWLAKTMAQDGTKARIGDIGYGKQDQKARESEIGNGDTARID